MSLFVDTSVWSLALRRDTPPDAAPVRFLFRTIQSGETLLTTGLVLQEILQGFSDRELGHKSWTDFPPFRFLCRIERITSGPPN